MNAAGAELETVGVPQAARTGSLPCLVEAARESTQMTAAPLHLLIY